MHDVDVDDVCDVNDLKEMKFIELDEDDENVKNVGNAGRWIWQQYFRKKTWAGAFGNKKKKLFENTQGIKTN